MERLPGPRLPQPNSRRPAIPGWACPLLLLLALTACTTPPPLLPSAPYVAPPTGPKARLLMRGTLDAGMSYTVIDYDGVEDCSRPTRVASGRPGADPAAVPMSANRIHTLAVVVHKPNNTACQSRWTFMFRAGHSYLLSARSLAGGCEVAVLDATQPDAMQAEPSLRRRDAPQQACVPIAQTRTLAELNASARQRGDAGLDLPIPGAGRAKSAGVTEDDLKGLMR